MHQLLWPSAAVWLAQSAPSPDWKAFADPQEIVLIDPVTKSVARLPDKEQTAARQRLREFLAHKEVEVRRRAALTLGKLGDGSGVPVMIADLAMASGRDRDNVIVALRILKDPRAIPTLRGALTDPSPYVRGIALGALGELKAVAAYDEIVALTTDKETKPDCLRILPGDMACYALGALGEKRAVPVLIERMRDKDLANQAQQALETLTKQKLGADPEAWTTWWKTQQP